MRPGELLRSNKTQILKRWEECVRREIETASQQHTLTLHDHLPPFVDALCSTLDEPHDDEHAEYQVDMSKVHGETRALLADYDLYDVLREYSYLRRIIIAFLFENQIEDRISHAIVNRSIDLAMATAGQQFMDDRKEKLEKALVVQKDLNVEMDKFVAVAAHDLRSPLATMIGFLEVAKEDPSETAPVDRALMIANRSLKMVESLLRRARIRNGVLDKTSFSVCDLVEELAVALQAELEEKGAKLACESKQTVFADRDAISQLMQNLIANSLKFSQDGRPLRVRVDVEHSESYLVQIHIRDNGIGITKGNEDEIFEAFHREGEKSGALGLGLGLDTCRRIARAHGGDLVSVPEVEGAHFILTLPVGETVNSPERARSS